MSAKPSPLSGLAEFLPPAKGMAAPAPAAALAEAAAVAVTAPAPASAALRPDLIERGQGRQARIQVSLRLDQDRHEQLRRISYELHQPVQTIVERLLSMWMDRYDEAKGRGP